MIATLQAAPHPGEVLEKEYLIPLDVSYSALAAIIQTTPEKVERLVHGLDSVTPEMAEVLGRWLGPNAEFWMELQARFDSEL